MNCSGYLPLARWWSRRQAETAELHADHAAIGYAGRQAVASALLAAGETVVPAGAAAYCGVTGACVAQLLGDELPAWRPASALVILPVLGLIAAVWLAMRLSQSALAWAAPGRGARHRCCLGDNRGQDFWAGRVAAGGGVRSFGELEAAIMDRVWLAGRPVLVREVWAGLRPGREPAYNTVLTVLTVMEILYRKGWLAREKDDRAFRYRATVSREDYTAGLMGEALEASPDRAAALRSFVGRIGPAEARQLRRMLDQALRDEAGS